MGSETTDFEKQIYRLYKEAVKEAKAAGIPYSKNIASVTVNRRARKRLGCCKEIKRGTKKTYHIEVSAFLEGTEEQKIKEVILHELLHTCYGCMNHGARWKSYAARLNQAFGYEITTAADYKKMGIETENAVKGSYRYMILCNDCGVKGYRMKKSKVITHPQNYKCSACGGTLTVYTLPQERKK